MKNTNPFKAGDVVAFKEDQTDDFMFKEDRFTVRSVIGHCVYLEYIYKDAAFDGFLPPLPRNTDDAWHYKAFEIAE